MRFIFSLETDEPKHILGKNSKIQMDGWETHPLPRVCTTEKGTWLCLGCGQEGRKIKGREQAHVRQKPASVGLAKKGKKKMLKVTRNGSIPNYSVLRRSWI